MCKDNLFGGIMQRAFLYLCLKIESMTQFNEMQTIKRNLFAMRNGIVADSLRKAGSPFPIIFGVNLPQLDEIAAKTGKNLALARSLYEDSRCRESMLIAPMLFPPEEMTTDIALEWLAKSKSTEVTDILCHKLLRKLPFAAEIASKALDREDEMMRYGGIRMLWNLLPSPAREFRDRISEEARKRCALTQRVSEALIEELDFLDGC